MITFLTGLGLTTRLVKLIAYVGIPLAIIGALWLTLHLYGNARYQAGRDYESALYKAASDKLLQQAATSASQADRQSVVRNLDFVAKQEHEKEKIDAAVANGSSAFDAMFPAGNSVR